MNAEIIWISLDVMASYSPEFFCIVMFRNVEQKSTKFKNFLRGFVTFDTERKLKRLFSSINTRFTYMKFLPLIDRD